MTAARPLAVTMGDPAGIGPEIVVKCAAAGFPSPTLVLGDAGVLGDAVARYAPGLRLERVDPHDALRPPAAGVLALVETGRLPALPTPGRVDALCGRAAYDAVRAAIDLALAGRVGALVTAPIHKAALAAAAIDYPGHTEILADFGGAERVAMMLVNDELRTVLVTIHCSLRDAIAAADFDAQLAALRFADAGARGYGVAAPRVAVAGLNPHAGESGLFGREEIDIIAPAIAAARAEGIDASGPWPGDTVFMQARRGRFDVVVAQYHDQGLIPVKYLGLDDGVNVTLGLPFVRTSPDHGTAFDIAGRGRADPRSLQAALRHATRLAAARQ